MACKKSGTTFNISTSRFEHNLFTSKLRYLLFFHSGPRKRNYVETKKYCRLLQTWAVDDSDVPAARHIDNLIIAQILPEALAFTNASATILPTLSFVCTYAYRKRQTSFSQIVSEAKSRAYSRKCDTLSCRVVFKQS